MARIIDAGPGSSYASERAYQQTADKVSVSLNPALVALAQAKSVLLLQGPVGPFFDRLAVWLKARGTVVHRIALQGGDVRDAQIVKPIQFLGQPESWPAFLSNHIGALGVDCLVLFGQTRRYHAEAIQLAKVANIPVVVLEEGYIRPGYVTMELGGVNGYSTTLDQYHWSPDAGGAQLSAPPTTENQFWQMAFYAMRHYLHLRKASAQFPHYEHHKPTSIRLHSAYWLRSFYRKQKHKLHDHRMCRQLAKQPYFLVALQHDGDSQITHHSRFSENTDFIIEVMRSFAHFAPADHRLVFKQHPFSRGGHGHAHFIHSLSEELGLGDRVVMLVEGHTPTLVRRALGVLVINSTVGIQALQKRKPLLVMGDALYKQPGITFSGELDQFWTEYHPPAEPETQALLAQIIHLTQAPCNVYGLASEPLLWQIPQAHAQ